MITEVMAFYKTWSKKLEEIKQKSLRGYGLDDSKNVDVDVVKF